MIYIATRKLVLMGQIYDPGDEIEPDGLDHELEVIYLARQFMLPVGGEEALDDELYLEVMEARD